MSLLEDFTPFPAEFAARYRQMGYWEDKDIGQFFEEICRKYPDRIALAAGSQKITYSQLAQRVLRLALHLLKLGLKPLDVLVLQLPNVPELFKCILGEKVCAFVVLLPGEQMTLEELTGYLQVKNIARFKLPEGLMVIDELPLSKFGKIAKNVLAQQLTK